VTIKNALPLEVARGDSIPKM